MKKSLVVAAVLSALAGVASAQSTVTVFGVLDVNLRHIRNGDTKDSQVGTDGLNNSRLGFQGTEDLGGGLSAGFWLESALKPDTGTTSAKFWHRRSTVSLAGGFGELRVGRHFTPTYTAVGDFDAFGDSGVGSFSNLQSSLTATVNTNTRADNQVSYFLPKNLGGVYGQLSVAAGEGTIGNRYAGGRVGFAKGALDVTGAYGQTEADAAEEDYKIGALGASYDFGVVKVMASFSHMKYVGQKENLFLVGATAPVGAGVIKVSLGHADLSGGAAGSATGDSADANLMAAGYVHNLSKRTALYATASRISNKDGQVFSTGTTVPGIAAGRNSTGYELGLRHSF